jgi:exodeoxyribonuclease V alpha subunit
VRAIDELSHVMTVEFDEGRCVEYPFAETEDLELAYAVTIHKSQGSEYPAVIIPLLSGPGMLLTRNLLYTAVTRARSCVVLLGSEAAFRRMIDNVRDDRRFTSLDLRISELCGQDSQETV